MYVGHSPDPRRPAIAHEFGGWLCSLPNLALTRRFTGVLEPYWTREEEWLRESGLWEIYPEIMKNSQRLLFLARKFRIEELRRNPRLQGYQQWLINDFPSGTHQGYLWEEGVLDFFWEPKVGSSGQWSQLNGATLLLTDADISQRTWWHGESSRIGIQVSHYGPRSLEKAHLLYSLEHEGNTLLEGSVPDLAVPRGEVTTLTNLQIPGAGTGRGGCLHAAGGVAPRPDHRAKRLGLLGLPQRPPHGFRGAGDLADSGQAAWTVLSLYPI